MAAVYIHHENQYFFEIFVIQGESKQPGNAPAVWPIFHGPGGRDNPIWITIVIAKLHHVAEDNKLNFLTYVNLL